MADESMFSFYFARLQNVFLCCLGFMIKCLWKTDIMYDNALKIDIEIDKLGADRNSQTDIPKYLVYLIRRSEREKKIMKEYEVKDDKN